MTGFVLLMACVTISLLVKRPRSSGNARTAVLWGAVGGIAAFRNRADRDCGLEIRVSVVRFRSWLSFPINRHRRSATFAASINWGCSSIADADDLPPDVLQFSTASRVAVQPHNDRRRFDSARILPRERNGPQQPQRPSSRQSMARPSRPSGSMKVELMARSPM
jgi:hypothetical protein